jgi:hypothetical protein
MMCGACATRALTVALLCGALVGVGAAFAEEKVLYRWIDSKGRTHFSDRPPAGPVERIEEQSVPLVPPQPSAAAEDFYSIENQARRLAEERRAREAARQEAARVREEQRLRQAQLDAARAQRQAAEAHLEAAEQSVPRYWVPYRWPAHPPRRYHPRPSPRPDPVDAGRFRLPRMSSPYHDRRSRSSPFHGGRERP